MTFASAAAGAAGRVLAVPWHSSAAGGCRSALSRLDFGVRVALLGRGTRLADQGAGDRERGVTLTLLLQDGAC